MRGLRECRVAADVLGGLHTAVAQAAVPKVAPERYFYYYKLTDGRAVCLDSPRRLS